MEFRASDDGTTVDLSGGTVATGVWDHYGVDRSGSTVKLYLEGEMVASGSFAGTMFNNSTIAGGIGQRSSLASTWNGWIDEVRITKGAARYASDGGFTPPTAAFPRSCPNGFPR